MAERKIAKRLEKKCCVCAKNIHALVYNDRKIRGGHYFGKIPLYRKSELDKMSRSGTHKSKLTPTWTVDVCNYDPKPYASAEYWECPECYWHPKFKSSPINKEALRTTLRNQKNRMSQG